ncbi:MULTISPECIES: hypothetical protein [Janibacter]|uniref:hypothetical protein n=1 Tax=Janibacter TaxID=53457 RepID=UPI000836D9FB|nr:hypothetical protein [Janibacter terrae]
MPKRMMWVSWEDGADLSHSRKSPGDFSPLTRDSGNNLGHVVLESIVEDDEEQPTGEPQTVYIYVDETAETTKTDQDETAELVAALLVIGVAVAIERRTDIAHWWHEAARPTLTRVRQRIRRPRRWRRRETGTALAPENVREAAEDVAQTLEAYRASMGSEEARDRLVAALMAKQFADEQFALLRNARIEDPDAQSASTAALEAVTDEELEAALERLLEHNPSLLESCELAHIGNSLTSAVVVSVPRRRQAVGREPDRPSEG